MRITNSVYNNPYFAPALHLTGTVAFSQVISQIIKQNSNYVKLEQKIMANSVIVVLSSFYLGGVYLLSKISPKLANFVSILFIAQSLFTPAKSYKTTATLDIKSFLKDVAAHSGQYSKLERYENEQNILLFYPTPASNSSKFFLYFMNETTCLLYFPKHSCFYKIFEQDNKLMLTGHTVLRQSRLNEPETISPIYGEKIDPPKDYTAKLKECHSFLALVDFLFQRERNFDLLNT